MGEKSTKKLGALFFEVTRWRYFRRRSEYSQKRPPSTDLVDRAFRTPATTVLYECGAQFPTSRIPPCVCVCVQQHFPIFAVSLFGETKVARTTVFCVFVFVYSCANRVGLFWWNVQGRWNKKRNNASSRASFLRHGSNTTVRKRRRPGEFSLDNFPSKGVFFLFFFLGSSCGPRHPLVSHPLAALFEKWFFIMYGSPLSLTHTVASVRIYLAIRRLQQRQEQQRQLLTSFYFFLGCWPYKVTRRDFTPPFKMPKPEHALCVSLSLYRLGRWREPLRQNWHFLFQAFLSFFCWMDRWIGSSFECLESLPFGDLLLLFKPTCWLF